jgi:eukaryotic-like serine/threonine-protein kinase
MVKIGKYKVQNEIGRGGFGRVFRAFDPTVGRTVAIKILIADNDEDLLARFRREATATGKLRHKNIVTIHDFGEQDNSPYLVMEYLEGEDLKASLVSGRISTFFDKTSVMTQVAEGLQHAHHHGIVHRDIKPANIMILSDGTVKIMDFGIARVMTEQFTTRLTRHGDVLGTISYMAPEVLQGTEVDPLCDIFSFGVIYYELIAGKHPFAADQPARVMYNITATTPPPVSTFAPDCPRDLEQLIARAIHKDRDLRYQSLEDLLFDLTPIRLQLQSAEAQSLIRKAETLVSGKHIREAQTVVRQVLQLDPNNTSARELREKLNREAQLQNLRERCEQLIASGTEQLNSLQYANAIETFESVLRLDVNNAEAEKLLQQARTALKKRERSEALIAQAKRELEADQLTDAYRSLLECLQHSPDNKEAAALLETIRAAIKARERQRRMAEGITRAEEMLATDRPEEAEVLLADLAVSYPAAPKVKQLATAAASAIEAKKRRRQLAEGLAAGQNLLSEKRWADAVSSFTQLAQQFPDEAQVRSQLEYAQQQLELQRKTERVEEILRLARVANDANDFEQALKLINEGLRNYPAEPSLKKMLSRTEELRSEHQRQAAIQAARERATELAAQKDFSSALAVIDLTARTWKTEDLEALRQQIQTKHDEFQRAQAIAKACASIKVYIDRERFEEALAAGQDALGKFPGEPSITTLIGTAQQRLAEQKRKARIKAVREQATVTAAEDQFAEALQLLQNAITELGPDPALIALHDQIEIQKKEHDREQAIAAAAAMLQDLLGKSNYDAALEAGRLALRNFPGDRTLTKLVEAAEQAVAQQRRAERMAAIQQDVESLASDNEFDAALKLLRSGIQELGSSPAFEDLKQSVEGSRREHEKQEAIRIALENARQLIDSTEYANAVALLEQSLGKYPGEAAMQSLLTDARGKLAAQQRSQAIEEILRKSRELVQAQQYQPALNTVRSGLREYPDDARLTARANEIRATIVEMEKERAIRAALNSATALQLQGEFGKAAELLELTLTKAPGQAAIKQALAMVQEKIAIQQKVNAVLDEVCELMSRGNFDEALSKVQQALVMFPDELALSSLLEEVKETKRTDAVAAAAREVEGFRSAGELAHALRRLEEALAAFPGDPALLSLKAGVQAEIEREQKRRDLSTLVAEIRHLLDEEQVDSAIARLQTALRDNPGESELIALHAYAKEILDAREGAEDIGNLAKKAIALLQSGKPSEAESLLKDAVTRYPEEETFPPLLARAQAEVAAMQAKQAAKRAPDAITSKLQIRLDTARPGTPKVEVTAPASTPDADISRPKQGRLARTAVLIGVLLVIALIVWVAVPRRPQYQEQFESARGFFQQKDYGKAIEALQEIPSTAPQYSEAQSLLSAAKDAEKQQQSQELLAQAVQQHNQGRNAESLATLQKILDTDPGNQQAKSLRDEIALDDYRKKTQTEQDRYVAAGVAQAQQLLNAGNVDAAKTKIDEVILLQPNDPAAAALNRRIVTQVQAVRKTNDERSKSAEAKTAAEKVRAAEIDQARFAAAQRLEETALRQQQDRRYDDAAKTFAEAAAMYAESEKASAAEIRARADRDNQERAALQTQQNQADAARAAYEQNRAKARAADAEAKAADRFQAATRVAADAQARFDRGDFTGARSQFEQASQGMVQAADVATRATQAAQQAAQTAQQAAQRTMDAARTEMEAVKRGLSARDARGAAEEGRAQQLAQEGKLADATTSYQTAASLYRDAAQREAAAQRDENERQSIRASLDRYKAAYERKDLAAMRSVFPMGAAQEKDVSDTFQFARTIQMNLTITDIQISGEAARVAARRQLSMRTTDNKNVQSPQESITFNLRKREGSWLIDSISR